VDIFTAVGSKGVPGVEAAGGRAVAASAVAVGLPRWRLAPRERPEIPGCILRAAGP
jgi:hypothetical protein